MHAERLLAYALFVLCSLSEFACSNSDERANLKLGNTGEGLIRTSSGWLFRTGQLTLRASEERFLCYATTVPEDIAVTRFSSPKTPFVHHFLLVSPFAPEPEGFSDCDTLFRPTWLPMYVATTGAGDVKIPAGAAKFLKARSQILVQGHLLNASSRPVSGAIEIGMDASEEENLEPVGITTFGSGNINLPARAETIVENTCTLNEDVRLYTVLPHMHYQGRRLDLEIGKDANSLSPLYARDPFDFDNQHFDPFEKTLPKGSVVRTRCTYRNDRNETVHFGESSQDEMCFLFGFRVGAPDLTTCTDAPALDASVPPNPDAGVCSDFLRPGGIGQPCERGANECRSDLFCSADLLNAPTGGCFKIGCLSDSDCPADGHSCCTLPLVGNMANICVPEACRPNFCIPVGR